MPPPKPKRHRTSSTTSISITELLPDDPGYEADEDTLHPDSYSSPSDTEPELETNSRPDSRLEAILQTPKQFQIKGSRQFKTTDEELAHRMQYLGQDDVGGLTGSSAPETPGSRKRRSLHVDRTGEEPNEIRGEHQSGSDSDRERRLGKRRKREGPRKGRGEMIDRQIVNDGVSADIEKADDVMDVT